MRSYPKRIFSAVSLALIMASGTPLPGRVDAPTKYKPLTCGGIVRGNIKAPTAHVHHVRIVVCHKKRAYRTLESTFEGRSAASCPRPWLSPKAAPCLSP